MALQGAILGGNASFKYGGTLRWYDGDEGEYQGLKSSFVVTASLDYTLPTAGPAANGYVLASTTTGFLSWAANTAGSTGGNPTASVGLAAVNGAAATFLRSDGAPALDQAIAPTWTGQHLFLYTALGITQDDAKGIAVRNTTAAAAGAQQISPAIRWEGQGWKTNATAASQSVEFRSWVLPVQGAANPTGSLIIEASVNGAAYTGQTAFSSVGGLSVGVASEMPAGVINADIGFRASGAATSGNYLRGNGTNFVSSAIQVADMPVRTLNVNSTSVGNVGAGEDTLITYSLPANTMATNGDRLIIRACGLFAGNANSKTLIFYFGAQSFYLAGPSILLNNQFWSATVEIIRTSSGGATVLHFTCTFGNGTGTSAQTSVQTTTGTGSDAFSGAITIKYTGTGVADNDVIQYSMSTAYLAAP